MMDSLRTAANSLVLKIIFGIIIVSFILTGVSGYLIGGGNNFAAKVNGQEISRGQFENAFNSERNRMQQQRAINTRAGRERRLHENAASAGAESSC